MRYLCLALLKFYKYVISPLKPKSCIYTPSCSVYSMEAFMGFGFFVGIYLTVRRLLRCTPFHSGGFDPVPFNLHGKIKWSL